MVFIKPSPRPSFTRKPVRVRSFNQLQPELRHLLYDSNSKVTGIFEKIEQQTGIKREHLTYGLLGLLGLYMVVGSLAELVCNLVGLVYPAYASVKAIRTEEKEDDTMWLTYWTVFATFFGRRLLGRTHHELLPVLLASEGRLSSLPVHATDSWSTGVVRACGRSTGHDY
ncbi:Receptor expression-enhancing protein [Aphelenchoides besseyi]|nr:Receptor expression-enhancing protein [Aphelenchoides besseyi]